MNPILCADAYTICGECLSSKEANENSTYNFTNRLNPADVFDCAHDSRMVMWGLSDFIKTLKVITKEDVDEAESFLSTANSFGGPLKFNRQPWDALVGKYLPIIIRAIPDGYTFYPNEPIIEVEGPGELAAHIEATMVGMVSIGTARATLGRHLLERIKDLIMKYHPKIMAGPALDQARWTIHDFGMRGSSCKEESLLLGRAHLLSFYGTDTFHAAHSVRKEGVSAPVGTSILALAHRTVQGYNEENDCFDNLYKQDKIGSYVADCYNFPAALDYLIKLADSGEKIVVVRPDSGDYLENAEMIVKKAIEAGLYKLDEEGRPTAQNLKFIMGDSMNYEKIIKVYSKLHEMGVDPTGWCIFGIGGWLRNSCTRDTLSSAYKLCQVGTRQVMKLSHNINKLSVPGRTVLTSNEPSVNYNGKDIKRTVFNGLKCYYNTTSFSKAMINNIDIFRMSEMPTNYGMNRTCLSEEVKKVQDEFYGKYQKT